MNELIIGGEIFNVVIILVVIIFFSKKSNTINGNNNTTLEVDPSVINDLKGYVEELKSQITLIKSDREEQSNLFNTEIEELKLKIQGFEDYFNRLKEWIVTIPEEIRKNAPRK